MKKASVEVMIGFMDGCKFALTTFLSSLEYEEYFNPSVSSHHVNKNILTYFMR